MKLNPYLNFNGNCKQAFDFYAKNLSAKWVMAATFDQAPKTGDAPDPDCAGIKGEWLMHARLEMPDGSVIMGSDCPPARFESMAGCTLNIALTDTEEAERLYKIMSDKGQIFMPMEETFWAKRFAMFKDQFGVAWMINVEKEMS